MFFYGQIFFYVEATNKKEFVWTRYYVSLVLLLSLPLFSPRPFRVFPVAVCLGALFYYLRDSTGKILRQRLPSNKGAGGFRHRSGAKSGPQREKGGVERERGGVGNTQDWNSSNIDTAGAAGWRPGEAPVACSPVFFLMQFIWGYCEFVKGPEEDTAATRMCFF